MRGQVLAGLALAWANTALGAVVINELHFNPADSQGSDDNYEFLELVNTGATAVSLAGWTLTGVAHTFAAGASIPAGGYLVLAKTPATVQAFYGITGVVAWGSGNLDNGGEWVRLQDASAVLVDELNYDDTAEWDGPRTDGGGYSLELINPGLDNNTATSWTGSATLAGTPGARNSVYLSDAFPSISGLAHQPLQPATTDVVTVSATVVDDHGLQAVTLMWSVGGVPQGSLAMSPAGGDDWSAAIGPFPEGSHVDLRVEAVDSADQASTSEVHALYVTDHAITDSQLMFTEIQYTDACHGHADWVELHNASASAIDLGGWIFKDNDDSHSFTIPAGTQIPAGGYLVLSGGAALLAADTGISNLVGDFDFGLSSGGDAVRVFTPWGVLVDAVEYSVTAPWPGPPVGTGPSLSLINPAFDNSLGVSWEPSGTPCGTPGLENGGDLWPPVVREAGVASSSRLRVLFNEGLDPSSAQDPAHYRLDGQPCLSALLLDSTTVELDFGLTFSQGLVLHLSLEGVEDPAGNALLPVVWPIAWWPAGSLVVNEIFQNPLLVEEAEGEWFEVFNPNAWDVNLSNWWLQDAGTEHHLLSPDSDLICPAGGYLLLAANGDPQLNGGITPDYVYSGITLTNGADELILQAGLTVVDRVAYDGGATFPDPNGASMELLRPDLDNELGASWRTALAPFGTGGLGTPGSVNSATFLPAPMVQIALSSPNVLLSWTAVPGAVEYVVESAPSLGSAWSIQAVTGGTTLALPLDATLRLIRVRARN